MAKTEHNSYRVRDTRRVVYVSVVVSGEKEGLVIAMVTGRRRVRAWVMVQSIKNSSFSPRDDDVVRTCGICPMCLAGLEYVKDRCGLERPVPRSSTCCQKNGKPDLYLPVSTSTKPVQRPTSMVLTHGRLGATDDTHQKPGGYTWTHVCRLHCGDLGGVLVQKNRFRRKWRVQASLERKDK